MRQFSKYNGIDLMGLPTNENHLVFKWINPACKMLFSMTRQGNAASCHFASDKRGMLKIRTVINLFCEFIFDNFDWCKMILAKVELKKIGRIIERCGFKKINEINEINIYMRAKSWVL